MIAKRYQNILRKVEPYILGNPKVIHNYQLDVFNKSFNSNEIMDCLDTKNLDFFNLIHKLDAITFGDQGMGMDKWVFFDCAAMPAGIIGFALKREDTPEILVKAFDLDDDYEGLVPISMYMAIPTSDRGRWFGHNLSSLKRFLGADYKGLGLLTKAYACKVFGIENCYGATQWGSPALEIHTQLSPMKLRASHLPAHTHENSLCYLSVYNDENLELALSGERRIVDHYDFLLKADDLDKQIMLQSDIEKGAEFHIVGRPLHGEKGIFYPIIES
jgi:hypothetical protein